MKVQKVPVNRSFRVEVTHFHPECQEDLEKVMADIRSRPDRSTYIKHLESSLEEWHKAAIERYDILKANMADGRDRHTCHILMENYNVAVEYVMAYEMALGKEPQV